MRWRLKIRKKKHVPRIALAPPETRGFRVSNGQSWGLRECWGGIKRVKREKNGGFIPRKWS